MYRKGENAIKRQSHANHISKLFLLLRLFLKLDKNGTGLADIAFLVSQLLDDTILWRADHGLHLHGFDAGNYALAEVEKETES